MKKKLLIAAASTLPLLGVQAQQDTALVRSLVVEHEYNPTILDATKINVLPKVEEPVAAKAGVEYATALRPLQGTIYEVMNPLTRPWETKKGDRGYVRAGYGNYGNVDFKAGYLWDMTSVDRMEINLHLDGMHGELNTPTTDDWKSRFYDSGIKLHYQHQFSGVSLYTGGGFQSQVFNYMPFWEGAIIPATITDKQNHTLANFLIGVKSHNEMLPLQFALETGFNYFEKARVPVAGEKMSEKEFYLKGDVWGMIGEEQRVGIAAQLNSFAYSLPQQDDFLSVELNPYYALQNDTWKLRLGAHVDWQNRNSSGFSLAPDVKIDYIFSDSYVAYVYAEGGRILNDFRRLNALTPYWNTTASTLSSYMPLNASIGIKGAPANNFWFNVFGGYRICEDDLTGLLTGNYQMHVLFRQAQAKAAYAGAELKYNYKERVRAGVKGVFYSWNTDSTTDGGVDKFLTNRPELELNAELAIQVLKPLELKVSYDYMKRPSTPFWGGGTASPIKMGNISNLNLGATYNVWKGLSLFVEGNNLLNKTYYLEGGYPAQGLNFLGGLSLKF
ncbi:MAG: TonB-dependent receptor [Phocaeicola sp.]